MDYTYMVECLNELCSRYANINVTSIGTSILGKSIPMICMGKGPKKTIYVGAIHGTDSLCASLLLRFINEYCEIRVNRRKIFNLNTIHIDESRAICIIPMAYTLICQKQHVNQTDIFQTYAETRETLFLAPTFI